METVDIYYCKNCEALVFYYSRRGTENFIEDVAINKDGIAVVKDINTIVESSTAYCDGCRNELECTIFVPIKLLQTLREIEQDLFYVDLGDEPEELSENDIKEKITIALMVE